MVNIYKSSYSNYYIPNMIKYWCIDCGKNFILSDGYDNSNIVCPYCQSQNTEDIVVLEDSNILSELECMTIGFLEESKKFVYCLNEKLPCKKHLDKNIIFIVPNKKGESRFCTKCGHYVEGNNVKRTHDEGC